MIYLYVNYIFYFRDFVILIYVKMLYWLVKIYKLLPRLYVFVY